MRSRKFQTSESRKLKADRQADAGGNPARLFLPLWSARRPVRRARERARVRAQGDEGAGGSVPNCSEESVEQNCAEVFHRNTCHFFSLRYSFRRRRRGARGRPTLPHDGPAPPGEPPGRRTESNPAVKSAKEQTCAWPPASESLHTYSCTRSTHVAAHGRAHGTTKKRLHEPHKRVAAHVTCTCNYQCLELRNSSEHVQNTSIWLVGTR